MSMLTDRVHSKNKDPNCSERFAISALIELAAISHQESDCVPPLINHLLRLRIDVLSRQEMKMKTQHLKK